METEIRITYTIDSEEWKRTAEMRRAKDVFPLNDCFYGRVSFRIGEREVFGTDQFNMSVGDLAVGLANVVGELRTGANGVFKFQQSDDMLEIAFQVGQDAVTVSHNLAPDQSWECNRSALEKTLIDFIASFTSEASKKVPDLFGWRDMEILQYFSIEHTKL